MSAQKDTLKELVKQQQEHIRMLESKINLQDKVIRRYQEELVDKQESGRKVIEECSEFLGEIIELRDSYRNTVSEIMQAKSEYDNFLGELISYIRSSK